MIGTAKVTGKVKWFDKTKGFGFLVRDDGGEDVFVHYSELEGKGFKNLEEGQLVEFELARGKKGEKAVKVKVISRA